jgi:hypothetical protein
MLSFIGIVISYLMVSYFGRRLNIVHPNIIGIPLIDVFHTEELKFMSKYYNVADYLIGPYLLLIMYFNTYLNAFFIVQTIINVLRCISFSLTILPKPGLMENKNPKRSLYEITWAYFSMKDKHVGFNNDLLFSGHVSLLVTVSLYMSYFYSSFIILNIILWITTVSFSMIIILSRCHYTIDVLYAYIICILIFQNVVVFGGVR